MAEHWLWPFWVNFSWLLCFKWKGVLWILSKAWHNQQPSLLDALMISFGQVMARPELEKSWGEEIERDWGEERTNEEREKEREKLWEVRVINQRRCLLTMLQFKRTLFCHKERHNHPQNSPEADIQTSLFSSHLYLTSQCETSHWPRTPNILHLAVHLDPCPPLLPCCQRKDPEQIWPSATIHLSCLSCCLAEGWLEVKKKRKRKNTTGSSWLWYRPVQDTACGCQICAKSGLNPH